jgi:hypothetical protein
MTLAVAVLGRALAAAGSDADAGLHGRALDGCAERGRCGDRLAAADDGCSGEDDHDDMSGDGLRSDGARDGCSS